MVQIRQHGKFTPTMSVKQQLNQRLQDAASLRKSGKFDEAGDILRSLETDPDIGELGQQTALGLPRRLQSALLKLAKAEKDVISSIAYQYNLVPPPDLLTHYTRIPSSERRSMVEANRVPVPRTIHQIWIGSNPVPAGAEAWQRHARANGYDYQLWREENLQELGITTMPVYIDMLSRGDFPGAVDVARYVILSHIGGIYLDCDWYPTRHDLSFHDFLPLTGLSAMAEAIPRNTGKGGLLLANSLIAAPPQHPVFSAILDVIDRVAADLPKAPAWWSTGPLIFTLVARSGSLTLIDEDFVAGALPQDTPMPTVEAFCSEAQAQDRGLLLAWKSWVW